MQSGCDGFGSGSSHFFQSGGGDVGVGFSLISSVNVDRVDIASSELIKVMISKRKEGRRAISVLWLY